MRTEDMLRRALFIAGIGIGFFLGIVLAHLLK